jgi:hypothetical protein
MKKGKPRLLRNIESVDAETTKKPTKKKGYLKKLQPKKVLPIVKEKQIEEYFDEMDIRLAAPFGRLNFMSVNSRIFKKALRGTLEECEPELAIIGDSFPGEVVLMNYIIKKKLLTPRVETYLRMFEEEKKPSKEPSK